MIEIVCKNGLQEEEKKLCLPKNIRQIGSPRGRHKIYIEDYVYTYLKSIAQKKESCAVVFLGKSQVAKDIRYTFVSGAAECGPGVFQWDSICLDESFWNHIEKEKQQYFPDKEIVGWFLGKTGQAMELTPVVEAAHRKYFPGRDKILMLMDILEQEEVFFIYDQGYLQKREGYYIYYEKNLPMQEYMVQKKEEGAGAAEEGYGLQSMGGDGELPMQQEMAELEDAEGLQGLPGIGEMQQGHASPSGKAAGSQMENVSRSRRSKKSRRQNPSQLEGATEPQTGRASLQNEEGTPQTGRASLQNEEGTPQPEGKADMQQSNTSMPEGAMDMRQSNAPASEGAMGIQQSNALTPESAMGRQEGSTVANPAPERDPANRQLGETAYAASGQAGKQAEAAKLQAGTPAGAKSGQPVSAAGSGRTGTAGLGTAANGKAGQEAALADARAASGQAQAPDRAKARQLKQKSARKKSGAAIAQKSGAEAKARVKAGTRARLQTGEGVKEYLELKKEFQELHKELEKELPTGSPEKIFAKSNLEEPKTQAEEALESYRHMILERQGRQIARQNRKFLYTASSFFLVAVCVLGITTINNYRKMQEVEDVLHVMSGNASEGKRAGKEDGPVVESVMSGVEPLQENGETPAATGEGQPASSGGQESGQAGADNNAGEGQPTSGGGQEAAQAGTGNGEGTGQPASGSGQESGQAGADNNAGEGQPTSGGGQEAAQAGTENSSGTGQPASGSSQDTDKAETGDSQGTETSSVSQPNSSGGNTDSSTESQQPSPAGEPSTANGTEETAAPQPRYYTVKPGDTLGSICISIYHDQGMMAKVCEANGIDNGDKIYVGQKLVLP